MRPLRGLLVLLIPGLLAVPGAVAGEFTVELTNGTTFQTRYRPREASWDASKITFLTDVGNWVAIDRTEVAEIVSETEARGFGTVIDTTTVVVGWAPNDSPVPQEGAAGDPMSQYLDFLREQSQNRRDYSVEQFVEPSQAGKGGLPAVDVLPGGGPGFTPRRAVPLTLPPTPGEGSEPGGGGDS